ncbi:RNA polymerase recycling motor HelD [Virgibacillus xinjiangensis]|uniref:RNA polymerase recycling motor HelD n=1 Tax=Virgibacillus xinjiangensis TaxID=393090 RepID=A0ABV7CUC7_9BACI
MSSPKDHPDYKNEKNRLEYTKDYIQSILEVASTTQGGYKENIKDAFVNLDHLDSSLSYINILTNARLLELIQGDIRNLSNIKHKPYFGRVDFDRDGAHQTETYYIGKVSLYRRDNQEPVIVDWRSPIANIYYDGRLGEVSYDSEEGEQRGQLALKRQYLIEHGELEEIRDIDVTTRDELLQRSLSETSDKRLNDIVATIQEEQNNVIRADLQKPMIVQGVAGSGKTTIALHRLSYFIYIYSGKVAPEEMMILAPNKMFINFIAESLPELGVEKIRQTTFSDYVFACLGKRLKLTDANEKLKALISPETEGKEDIKWVSQLKGSIRFENILKRYLKDIRNNYVPEDDVFISRFRLYPSKRLRQLFIKDYQYLPFEKRKEKIQELLKSNFQQRKKKILQQIEESFEERYDQINSRYKGEERREKMVRLLDNKEKRTAEVKGVTKKMVADYMKKFPKKHGIDYYKELLTDRKLLEKYAGDDFSAQEIEKLTIQSAGLKQNVFDLEDLAPILYLHTYIKGIPKELKMKYVVIDEGQDYNLLQIRALRRATGTNLFTILGDLSQGIHAYRGTEDWASFISHALPNANYLTLQKSYRTTVEIMDLANALLGKLGKDLPAAEPVVRHGEKPSIILVDTKKQLLEELAEKIHQEQEKGFRSIAVIGKTEKECKWIYQQLKKQMDVQLLKDTDELEHSLVIVPSYLAKGLEFDAVIITSFDETYSDHELDLKLLYVTITRGMHSLSLIGRHRSAFRLDEQDTIYLQD